MPSQIDNLTATVNDVVFCLQELQGQVEVVRQQVSYLAKHDEKLLLYDAEIQTLKASVKQIKETPGSNGQAGKDSTDVLKMKLLVRDLQARNNDELSTVKGLMEDLRTRAVSYENRCNEFLNGCKTDLEKFKHVLNDMHLHEDARPKSDRNLNLMLDSETVAAQHNLGLLPDLPDHLAAPSTPMGKRLQTQKVQALSFELETRPSPPKDQHLAGGVLLQSQIEMFQSQARARAVQSDLWSGVENAEPLSFPPVPTSLAAAYGSNESLLNISREELISIIFNAFDADKRGRLGEKDLLAFMKSTGDFRDVEFDGTDEEWAREYKDVCLEGGWDAKVGIDLNGFSSLVNDKSNEEYFCTDKQLSDIAATLLEATMEAAQSAKEDASVLSTVQCRHCKAFGTVNTALCDNCGKELIWEEATDPKSVHSQRAVRPHAQGLPADKLITLIADGNDAGAVAVASQAGVLEINEMDELGGSALHLAAERGQVSVILVLLARDDFDYVNSKDWYLGSTALHVAAFAGQVDACRALLECPRFTEGNDQNSEGNTALHNAAKQGHSRACECLLSHPDFTAANVQNIHGYTALHLAALNSHLDTCKTLLRHKKFTNVHAQSNWGTTAVGISEGDTHLFLSERLESSVAAFPGS